MAERAPRRSGDLAEVVAGPERRARLAADRDRGTTASIRKNAAPPEPSWRPSPLAKAALLEQPRDLAELAPVELLKSGTRFRTSTGALPSGSGTCPCDGPALKQVRLAAGERPLDVSRGAVDLLAATGKRVQLLELRIVEQGRSTSAGATSFSTVPPSGSVRIAIFLTPGARPTTRPERSTR